MLFFPLAILEMPLGNDREFIEQLYVRYRRLMFHIAGKYCDDPADVDDIVSDTCVALIKKVSTLRELEDIQLRTYVATATKNTAINWLTKRKRLESHFVPVDDDQVVQFPTYDEPGYKIVFQDELNAVMQAIRRLPEREQLVIRMKFSMRKSTEEIAEATGMSESSVRKYLSRARGRIRTQVYPE